MELGLRGGVVERYSLSLDPQVGHKDNDVTL